MVGRFPKLKSSLINEALTVLINDLLKGLNRIYELLMGIYRLEFQCDATVTKMIISKNDTMCPFGMNRTGMRTSPVTNRLRGA